MSSSKPLSNKLLAALPAQERQAVLDVCGTVELRAGDTLHLPGERIRHVHFPIDCVVSVRVTADGNDGLEVGMVGNEGLYGALAGLGATRSPLAASVQCAGRAFRIRADDFMRLLSECPALRERTNQFIVAIISQLAQTAYCTCYHVLEARVARWLLMTHDRVHANPFRLTHELLSEMLGVRRSGVSVAAASLQAQQLISYNRGMITVINRKGLEQASCECYLRVREAYRPLMA